MVKTVNRPSFRRFKPASAGPDPEGALPIFVNHVHRVVRQALLGGEGGELPVLQAVQPAGVGADPEASLAVFVQGEDAVVRQAHVGGEDLEAAVLPHAVETVVRADPEAPLPVLLEGEDGVVRQALLRGEGGEAAVPQAVQALRPRSRSRGCPRGPRASARAKSLERPFGREKAVKRPFLSRFRPPRLVPIQRLPSRSSWSA